MQRHLLSFGATCSIFHPHAAKKCCKYFAANFIRGAIDKNCCRTFTISKKKIETEIENTNDDINKSANYSLYFSSS